MAVLSKTDDANFTGEQVDTFSSSNIGLRMVMHEHGALTINPRVCCPTARLLTL